MARTQKNKATSGHLGMLKVRLLSAALLQQHLLQHAFSESGPHSHSSKLSRPLAKHTVCHRPSWQSCDESCWSRAPGAARGRARAKVLPRTTFPGTLLLLG